MMTVKETQEWLCLHGYLVKVDGINGPATRGALRKLQADNGLPETGAVDDLTEQILSLPLAAAVNLSGVKANTYPDAVLKVAKHYLCQKPREVGGENSGPWVRHFMKGKEGRDFPWCAGCVSVILQRAATVFPPVEPWFKYTWSCDNMAWQAESAGRLDGFAGRAGLVPGAVFLLRGKTAGDWVHAGIVTSFESDYFTTIEGNTNDNGSREGYKMCARTRAYRNVDFIRT